MNENPKIIVVAGCNGAGKSTIAPHLFRDAFGLKDFVNADTIAQGLSAFSPESVSMEAGRLMLKRLYLIVLQEILLAEEVRTNSSSQTASREE